MTAVYTVERMVRTEEDVKYVIAPPGLLLSLGDGRAVEVSVETMRRALAKFDNDQPMALLEAQVFLDILIQQAQEADRG